MAIAPKPKGNITHYYENGDRDINKSGNIKWKSLCITNDDTIDLTIHINGMSIIIKPGEVLDDDFEDFDYISVGTGQGDSLYRLWLRE